MDSRSLTEGSKDATAKMEELTKAAKKLKEEGFDISAAIKFREGIVETGSTLKDVSNAMRGFSSALLGIHMTVLGLVFSLTSINRTAKMVEKSQRDLNEAIIEGRVIAAKYGEDSTRFAEAQENVREKQDALKQSTEDLNLRQAFLTETYLMLALNVIPMVVTTYTSMVKLYDVLTTSTKLATATQYLYNSALAGTLAILGPIGVALGALTILTPIATDARNKWVASLVKEGKTLEEINDLLKRARYVAMTPEEYDRLASSINSEAVSTERVSKALNDYLLSQVDEGATLDDLNQMLIDYGYTLRLTAEDYQRLQKEVAKENELEAKRVEQTKEENRLLNLQNLFFRTVVSATDEYKDAIDATLPSVLSFIQVGDWEGLSAEIAAMATVYNTSFENIAQSIFGAIEETKTLVWASEDARLEYMALQKILDGTTRAYNSLESALNDLQDAQAVGNLEMDKNEVMIRNLQQAVLAYGSDIPAFEELMVRFKETFGESSAEVEWLTQALADDRITLGEAETAMDLLRQKNVELKDAQRERGITIDETKIKMDEEMEKMDDMKTQMGLLKDAYGGLEKVVGGLKDVLEKLTIALGNLVPEKAKTDLVDLDTKLEDLKDEAQTGITVPVDFLWEPTPEQLETAEAFKRQEETEISPIGRFFLDLWNSITGFFTPEQEAMDRPVQFTGTTPIIAHKDEVIGGVEALAKMFGEEREPIAEPREIVNEITVILDGISISKSIDRRLSI